MEKRPALPRTQDSHPVGAPFMTPVAGTARHTPTRHHDRTVAYPVGAPFMTPGTEAVRHTPTRHDGTHAAQQRTHAGDMNVAPTLPAVPTCTDEKTAGHHNRTAASPVGAPFMTPGTEAERQTSSCHNGAHAGDKDATDRTSRPPNNTTTHARGRHECRPYTAGSSHTHG